MATFNPDWIVERTTELAAIHRERKFTLDEKREFEDLNQQWFEESSRLIREENAKKKVPLIEIETLQ